MVFSSIVMEKLWLKSIISSTKGNIHESQCTSSTLISINQKSPNSHGTKRKRLISSIGVLKMQTNRIQNCYTNVHVDHSMQESSTSYTLNFTTNANNLKS